MMTCSCSTWLAAILAPQTSVASSACEERPGPSGAEGLTCAGPSPHTFEPGSPGTKETTRVGECPDEGRRRVWESEHLTVWSTACVQLIMYWSISHTSSCLFLNQVLWGRVWMKWRLTPSFSKLMWSSGYWSGFMLRCYSVCVCVCRSCGGPPEGSDYCWTPQLDCSSLCSLCHLLQVILPPCGGWKCWN